MTPRVAVAAICLLAGLAAAACNSGPPELGFWLEPIRFSSSATGPLTSADVDTVTSVARDEIVEAFAGYQFRLSDRRDAMYRVRVTQQLQDLRFKSARGGPAGQSFAVRGFGGSGAVNFELLASNAVGYAPDGAPRAAIVEAIGRGVGRAAVHEFAHQLLPDRPIDSRTDVDSYEYGYAGRAQQYWGTLRWSIARPWLDQRLGRQAAARNR